MNEDNYHPVSDVINSRVNVGYDQLVSGWQDFVASLLKSMNRYLINGSMVTFQNLLPDEKKFFGNLIRHVSIPRDTVALFIPPSVRHQMMYKNDPSKTHEVIEFDPSQAPDAGSIIISRASDYTTLVNVLFAYTPCTPAIDVYERGKMIAGYVYHGIDECVSELSSIIQTHFPPSSNPPNS
jgi:hypothetical protein